MQDLHVPPQKKTGHIPEWKTNALQNMSKIFMIVSSCCCFNFTFLNAENVGLQNTPKARWKLESDSNHCVFQLLTLMVGSKACRSICGGVLWAQGKTLYSNLLVLWACTEFRWLWSLTSKFARLPQTSWPPRPAGNSAYQTTRAEVTSIRRTAEPSILTGCSPGVVFIVDAFEFSYMEVPLSFQLLQFQLKVSVLFFQGRLPQLQNFILLVEVCYWQTEREDTHRVHTVFDT